MTTAAHTPGPWHFVSQFNTHVIRQKRTDGEFADYVASTWGDEHEANARLIAAAPTLLMALEFLLEQAESFNVAGTYFDQFRENRDALDTARDAIAKATGSAQ